MNLIFLLDGNPSLCTTLRPVWTIFGYIIWGIKIVVPLLLIITGMITMAHAVMEKDEKSIKSAQNLLVKKVIAAVIVYLVITLTGVIVNLVSGPDFKGCATCAFNPFGEGCKIVDE